MPLLVEVLVELEIQTPTEETGTYPAAAAAVAKEQTQEVQETEVVETEVMEGLVLLLLALHFQQVPTKH